jgi:hypothetical protein
MRKCLERTWEATWMETCSVLLRGSATFPSLLQGSQSNKELIQRNNIL